MDKEHKEQEAILSRMDRHMKGLHAMISDAISFFTDIERQRDDVAPAGMHIPMSIHVRDGRKGLIVKHYTMMSDADTMVIIRLLDRKIPREFHESSTRGINHEKTMVMTTDTIAFSHTGKTLKTVMDRIDAILREMLLEPSEHIHIYSGFSQETHPLIHSVILDDKNAVTTAWNALSSAAKKKIIQDLDNPNSFFSRDIYNNMIL